MKDGLIIFIIVVIMKFIFCYSIIKENKKKTNYKNIMCGIAYQIPNAIFLGSLPTFLLWFFPSDKGFSNDLKSFVPLNHLLYYFVFLSIVGLLLQWISNKKNLNSKWIISLLKFSISGFQGIYHLISGVLFTLTIISLLENPFTKSIFISCVFFVSALFFLIPAYVVTKLNEFVYKKKKELIEC